MPPLQIPNTALPTMETTSPHVLTPSASSTTNKPLAPMPGTPYTPAISMNKEWVLPPKPKPGRKPAVDTPPTKRKAQNREAQRAFRERRAAKVSELEDQMKVREEEDQKQQEQLVARVKQLEHVLEDYTDKLIYWRRKYSELEIAYERERQIRQSTEIEMEMLRERMTSVAGVVELPSRRPAHSGYLAEPAEIQDGTTVTELNAMGCGRCSAETRCQCIDEAFKMDHVAAEPDAPTFKRPHSPQSNTDNKRRQLSNHDTSLEIDFTSQFSTRRPPTFTTSASNSSSIAATALPDPCGFCSDSSTCLCAELAKERPDRALKTPASTLPTPPEIATTKPSTPNPCINGPGTCTQCRSNPISTLFCKTLATTRPTTLYQGSPTRRNACDQIPTQGSTLNCADAFIILSRHPGFDQATSEISTWIPQLSTAPSTTTAFDVEAASVLGVLKLFDRRFGNRGKNEPSNPKEASSDRLDQFSTHSSQSAEKESASDEGIKAREIGGGHQIRKDINNGDWISYGSGAQAKGKPGRPKVQDRRWPEDLRAE